MVPASVFNVDLIYNLSKGCICGDRNARLRVLVLRENIQTYCVIEGHTLTDKFYSGSPPII